MGKTEDDCRFAHGIRENEGVGAEETTLDRKSKGLLCNESGE